MVPIRYTDLVGTQCLESYLVLCGSGVGNAVGMVVGIWFPSTVIKCYIYTS